MKKILKVLCLMIVQICILVLGCGMTALAGTDVDSIKEDYPEFERIITKETFDIPGLKNTDAIDGNCDCMTPQGICVSEDYIFITAYCNSKYFVDVIANAPQSEQRTERLEKEESHPIHRSVIYVLSKSSHELINVLVLPDINRLSGIAFDGQFIWVGRRTAQELGVFRYEDIIQSLTNDGSSLEINYYTTLPCDNYVTFITYYDGMLWIGECNDGQTGNGMMAIFDIAGSTDADLELIEKREYNIPECANGAALVSIDGETCLAINSSDNTDRDSRAFLFSVNYGTDYFSLRDYQSFALPPMAEEICIEGSKVYTLFESGATPYCTLDSNKCSHVVDQVCVSGLNDWFYWTDPDYQNEENDIQETQPTIDGMYYDLTNAEDGCFVPNYVTTPDSDKKSLTLYNPYTAKMAYYMSLKSYKVLYPNDQYYMWSNALEYYGYKDIQCFQKGEHLSLGTIEEDGKKGIIKELFSSVNATVGFKKLIYNGKPKISICIAFRGTHNFTDFLTDVKILRTAQGFHAGFARTAKEFYDSFNEITMEIDGKIVSLDEIVESMKEPDSEYCMIVTGHSLGGAIADLLVGYNLYEAGVHPANVVAYTFAAARSASTGYKYPYTNIFNIINSDDAVPRVGNDKHIGMDIVYHPNESFRNSHYPELSDIEEIVDKISLGMFGHIQRVLPAHDLSVVYSDIINIIENDLPQYAPDNVYGFSTDERVYINPNCFCIYENNVSADGLGLTNGNVYIKGDLSVGSETLAMTHDNDYLLIGGNFSTLSSDSHYNYLNAGTVELKGDFTETYNNNFNYGGYREEGTHKTIFSGEGPQRIYVKVSQNRAASRFENLEIKNPDIYFDTDVYSIRLAADTEVTSGTTIRVYDHLDLNGYNLKTNGDVAITDYYKINSNSGLLLTNGGSFDVAGKISCGNRVSLSENNYSCGSMSTAGLIFSNSALSVKGNLSIGPDTLSMTHDDDYLLVEGNFSTVTPEINSYPLSAGTVELKGDFSDTYSVTFKGGGYKETGTHKTIFSGEGPQRISIKVSQNREASRFENLEIKNPELYFDTDVHSIRLAADAEITSGTPIGIYDHLDLNGHDLKTDGNVTIADQGELYTNGGSFDVAGKISCGQKVYLSDNDYSCGSLSAAGLSFDHSKLTVKGDMVIYDNYKNIGLAMSHEDDYLLIEGNLTCKTTHSNLSGGTIELKGDLTAKSNCYAAGLQHVTILSGAKKQSVECWSNYSNKFGTLVLQNDSEEGATFTGKIAVGTLFDHNRKVYEIENESGSSFVDYDGDGKKDNVDRFPTIKDVPAEEFEISGTERQLFRGGAIEPAVTVQYGDETLLKDVDYKVSYSGNDKPGSATITVDGLDNFTGSKAVEFEIYCEHSFAGGVTTEPSCTEAGVKTLVCDICGLTETEEIPAAGHKWATEYTADKEPTNTEDGSKSIHCTVCGAIREGSEVVIPKLVVLGKTTRGDMFNLANNVKVTWKEVSGAKYYKVYREGITDPSESLDDPVIVTSGLVGWDKSAGLTNGHAYRYKIVASLTGARDPSGDSTLSYSKVMYRLKTVVIRSAKNTAAGKVTVKYDKTTSGDSYVLQYCDREDMVGAKTKVVLGAGNTSYVIGGLKKGKTYYISIRVRKKVNGIDYYTTFGVPKKVKITK